MTGSRLLVVVAVCSVAALAAATKTLLGGSR